MPSWCLKNGATMGKAGSSIEGGFGGKQNNSAKKRKDVNGAGRTTAPPCSVTHCIIGLVVSLGAGPRRGRKLKFGRENWRLIK
jgi:hypothetical protein